MLEDKIERLTAEIIKLREALEKKAGSTGEGTGAATADKAAGKKAAAKKSKYTAEQVKAAVVKVKDEISKEKAQEIIKGAGAAGLAELITQTDKFDDVMAACEAAHAEAAGGDEDDDDL
jgi:adenylosuccinate synthase